MQAGSRTRLLLVVAAGGLAGCPASGIYRGAETVAPGTWRVTAASGVGVLHDREYESRAPTAQLDVGVRRGLTENLDAGVRLYTVGAEASATWRIIDSDWSLALAPSIGGLRTMRTAVTTDALHLFAGATAIISRPISPRWQLSAGPGAGAGLYLPATGGHAEGVWMGGFVNACADMGTWMLIPEIGVMRVVSGEVPVDGAGLYAGVGFARGL